MLKTFGFDLYNDINFDGENNLVMIDSIDEAEQSLIHHLMTRQGEWFLNTRHGLRYDAFLGQKYDRAIEATRAAFLECLNQEPRVQEVLNLDLSFDGTDRTMTVNFSVRMDNRIIDTGMEVII